MQPKAEVSKKDSGESDGQLPIIHGGNKKHAMNNISEPLFNTDSYSTSKRL